MLFYLKVYLLTMPVFFALDLIWIGFVARDFYRTNIGFLLSPKVNWVAALVFYLLYIVGILIFAILPAVEKDSLAKALVLGGLFGFFTYATYDLTNLATLKGWPLRVAVVDILWGVFLCSVVSASGFGFAKWMK